MKIVISSLFVWTCHLHYSEALVVTSVMCIEKEWVLKSMYHLEGRIACRDGYYISRDVSRAAMDTIFQGAYRAPRWFLLSRVVSCAATDAWTDMSPWVPDWEIAYLYRLVRHISQYLTLHFIVFHIFIICELMSTSLWSLWWVNLTLCVAYL